VDVRRFQLQLMQSGLAPGTVDSAMVGLRFFFRVTLRSPEALDYIPIARGAHRLPVVMTPEEVTRLLEAAPGPKMKSTTSGPRFTAAVAPILAAAGPLPMPA